MGRKTKKSLPTKHCGVPVIPVWYGTAENRPQIGVACVKCGVTFLTPDGARMVQTQRLPYVSTEIQPNEYRRNP